MVRTILQNASLSPLAASRLIFLMFGITFSAWATQLPVLTRFYGLSNSHVALALFAVTAGAMAGMTQAARLTHLLGGRDTIILFWLFLLISFPLVFIWPNPIWLGFLMLFIGVALGIVDVVVNAEAAEVEKVLQRPVLSGIHGMFSLGGLIGAAASSSLLNFGVHSAVILILIMAVTYSLSSWSAHHFLPVPEGHVSKPSFVVPRGFLLWLALATMIGMMIEGSVYDWSTLLMVEAFNSTPAFAAWSYGAFSAAMALGRFSGDWLRGKMSAEKIISYSGAMVVFSLGAGLLIGNAWFMLFMFALMGLAISNWVPVFYAFATQRDNGMTNAQAISSLATVGYVGFLFGPVVFGFTAAKVGIANTYWGIVLMGLFMVWFAPRTLRSPSAS